MSYHINHSSPRVHKDWAKHVLWDGEDYVDELAIFAGHKSVNDVTFGFGLNSAVCSNIFFLAVRDMIDAPISPLTVHFAGSGDRVLIASQRTLTDIAETTSTLTSVTDFRSAVFDRRGAKPSMVEEFLSVNATPEVVCQDMSFDACIRFGTMFYFLAPIPDGEYLRGLFDRLTYSGMVMSVDYASLVALGPFGLMSCSCSCFLHRAWCIHACVCAFKRRIIQGYPANMDPLIRGVGRPSNPKKAKGGKRDFEAGGLCSEVDDIEPSASFSGILPAPDC